MPAPKTFMTPSNLAMFWGFVRWFLILAAPLLFIFIAINMVDWIVTIVRGVYSADDVQKDDRIRDIDQDRDRVERRQNY